MKPVVGNLVEFVLVVHYLTDVVVFVAAEKLVEEGLQFVEWKLEAELEVEKELEVEFGSDLKQLVIVVVVEEHWDLIQNYQHLKMVVEL